MKKKNAELAEDGSIIHRKMVGIPRLSHLDPKKRAKSSCLSLSVSGGSMSLHKDPLLFTMSFMGRHFYVKLVPMNPNLFQKYSRLRTKSSRNLPAWLRNPERA